MVALNPAIHGTGPHAGGQSAPSAQYSPVGQSRHPLVGSLNNTTESQWSTIVRVAGTFSLFYVGLVTTASANITFAVFKNGTASAVSILVAGSMSGYFSDTTHTSSIAATDTASIGATPASSITVPELTGVGLQFAPTTTTVEAQAITAMGADQFSTASTTFYELPASCLSGAAGTTTLANAQAEYPINGTLSNLAINVQTNTRTSVTTVKSNLGGVAGNQTFTIAASTAGYFEDTTHTDSYTALTKYAIAYITGTGSSPMKVDVFSSLFTASNVPQSFLISGVTSGNNFAASPAATQYASVHGGGQAQYTTVSIADFESPIACTLSNWAINLITNGYSSGTIHVAVQINDSSGNQTIPVSGSTTGWLTDSTHTDSISIANKLSYAVPITSTSNAFTIQQSYMQASIVNTYNQAATVAESSSLALGKSANKGLSNAEASVMSALKSVTHPASIVESSTISFDTPSVAKGLLIAGASAFQLGRAITKAIALSGASAFSLATPKTAVKALSASGGSSLSLARIKQAAKALTIAGTSAFSFVKAITPDALAFAEASAVSLKRNAARLVSFSEASALSRLSSVGHNLALSVSSSLIADRSSVAKTIALASAQTLTALKGVAHALAASTASSAALLKPAGKHLSASGVSSVTLGHALGSVETISESSTMSLQKAVAHLLSITEAGAISLRKQAGKALAITGASALSKLASVGKPFSISQSSVVTESSTRGKPLSFAESSLLSLAKQAGKDFALATASSMAPVKTIIVRLVEIETSTLTQIDKIIRSLHVMAPAFSVVTLQSAAARFLFVSTALTTALQKTAGKVIPPFSTASVLALGRGAPIILSASSSSAIQLSKQAVKLFAIAGSPVLALLKAAGKRMAIAQASVVTINAPGKFILAIVSASNVSEAATKFRSLSASVASALTLKHIPGKLFRITGSSALSIKRSAGKLLKIAEGSHMTIGRGLARKMHASSVSTMSMFKGLGHSLSFALGSLLALLSSVIAAPLRAKSHVAVLPPLNYVATVSKKQNKVST